MNAKYFKWVFLPVLATILLSDYSNHTPFIIGLGLESSQNGYRIAGGTAPWALAFAVLIICLYFLLMYAPPAKEGQEFFSWWKRLAAFLIDFYLSMMAVCPLLGLLPALAEWRRTGVFAWSFQRTTPAPGDGLLDIAVVILAFSALGFYFAFPLLRRMPSPGTCVMGYQVVADEGVNLTLGTVLMRMLKGTSFLGDRKKTTFRIDELFGTHAVKLN
jgi:uncharacterized RDD family membrane protein YckC